MTIPYETKNSSVCGKSKAVLVVFRKVYVLGLYFVMDRTEKFLKFWANLEKDNLMIFIIYSDIRKLIS